MSAPEPCPFDETTVPSDVVADRVKDWLEQTDDLSVLADRFLIARRLRQKYAGVGGRRNHMSPTALAAREIELRCARRSGQVIRQQQRSGLLASRGKSDLPGPNTILPEAPLDMAHRVFDKVDDDVFEGALGRLRAGLVYNTHDSVYDALGVGSQGSARTTRRNIRIAELARDGYRTGQIASMMGIGEPWVRHMARRAGVELVDDRIGPGRAGIDPNRVVEGAVTTLDGIAMSLALVVVDDLDQSLISDWSASMRESLRTINQLLKEMSR